ncbi:MAG: CpXC domain-containing protein [Eubacteriaceae bacterium]|nr:CpXC domain-containing protein [Eubacteriaceae bacterium]
MAKSTREMITCPSCGKEVEVEMFESADGAVDPQIRAAILEGRFGICKCSECGNDMDLSYQFAYHDGSKKIMVWLMPPGKDGDTGEGPAADDDMIAASSLMENCALRKVRDKNELREKILLAEEGRDDRVVELMKPGIYSALMEQLEGKDIVAIFYEKNEKECFVVQLNSGEVGTVDFPEEMYEGIKDRYHEQIEESVKEEMTAVNNRWAADFVGKYMTEQ